MRHGNACADCHGFARAAWRRIRPDWWVYGLALLQPSLVCGYAAWGASRADWSALWLLVVLVPQSAFIWTQTVGLANRRRLYRRLFEAFDAT